MGKPLIQPYNCRNVAGAGVITVKPGASDVSMQVAATTAFMSMDEVYQLIRTLDHHATTVWGKKWVELFLIEGATQP